MRLRILFSIATVLLVTACVPYRSTERPLIVGAAVDTNRDPITGATVKLRVLRDGRLVEVHDLTTVAKGRFQLQRQNVWMMGDPSEWASYAVRVEVSAAGFEPEKREMRWLASGPPTLDFGYLRLRKM
jgi:hypothetical protein